MGPWPDPPGFRASLMHYIALTAACLGASLWSNPRRAFCGRSGGGTRARYARLAPPPFAENSLRYGWRGKMPPLVPVVVGCSLGSRWGAPGSAPHVRRAPRLRLPPCGRWLAPIVWAHRKLRVALWCGCTKGLRCSLLEITVTVAPCSTRARRARLIRPESALRL